MTEEIINDGVKCENCEFYYEDEVFDGENDWIRGFCEMKQDMFLAEYENKCKYYNQEVD